MKHNIQSTEDDKKLKIQYLHDEHFFGGAVNDGVFMPYKSGFSRDLRVWHAGNQAISALLSDRGRLVYSAKPFCYAFDEEGIRLEGTDIAVRQCGDTLRDAFLAMRDLFSDKTYRGQLPPKEMFALPQYNTWIEMEWDCTQEKVLRYAREILENGYPAGVLMIDDCWCKAYGDWVFDAARFPSPGEMVDELHKMGFRVMLWCCPFISPDTAVFRKLEAEAALVKTADGQTAISHWWNGFSAVLDLTNPSAVGWFDQQATRLMTEYGIDGFKLDAADPEYYPDGFTFFDNSQRSEQAKKWAEIGAGYAYNELRAGFNAGWLPVANRLRDKNHSWTEDGLNTLVPDGIAMGLCGYQYLCPDMIGGGMVPDFHRDGFVFDGELFVRYCQVAAAFPMMQFSRAPWKVLSKEEQGLCLKAVELHLRLSESILQIAEQCAQTGEPILRSLEYVCPHRGYFAVNDEFLLGNDILVAPQLKKGASCRNVVLPDGIWTDEYGQTYEGGTYTIDTPMERLPLFTREIR